MFTSASDPASAVDLAQQLLNPDRVRTVVVISTGFGIRDPYFDVERLLDEVGPTTEVAVLRTGPASRAFASRMPARTDVYGGAARVYPPTPIWAQDPTSAPLRFASTFRDSKRITDELAAIALSVAASSTPVPSRPHVSVEGTVTAVLADAARALIQLTDGSVASVAAEGTQPGVPLDRILTKGMNVSGRLDPASRQLDIRSGIRPPDQALAHYRVGDVVLVEVTRAEPDGVAVLLFPGLTVEIPASAVSFNPLDDVTDLVAVGEHVAVRVVSIDPWALAMADVDDDETTVDAPPLLDGGPPWLLPARVPREWDAPLLPPAEPWHSGDPGARPGGLPVIGLPDDRPGPPRPAPMVDSRAPGGSPPSVPPEDPDGLAAAQAEARRAFRQLTRALERADQKERECARLGEALAAEQRKSAAARKAAKAPRDTPIETEVGHLFQDPEQGFRVEVLLAWAKRFPGAEQAARPLPGYRVGPGFLESLAALQGVSTGKVVDVVVEVLTGVADVLESRRPRPYRVDDRPNGPQRTRQDRATAWRVNLQSHTAAARRLHYWRLPDGTIELWDVRDHDDHRR